ncbi:MAG: hypothetical protein FJ267_07300 [Planctomycetes bacterium]|nr:hypothetical protein [Planctomycetota bacterium]
MELADANGLSPEAAFEKKWALTLIDRALDRLRQEMAESGKAVQFETLKPWLIGSSEMSPSDAAHALQMNENALKVAIHRIRRRFGEMIKSEIAQTVHDPKDQELELNELIVALSR